jgi:choline-sulfatase
MELSRREFLGKTGAGLATAAMASGITQARADTASKPNVLFVMTDQQRFDTIHALGNSHIHTPNLDRLVKRGVSFTNAYSTCPVCVPARYTIRTGCFAGTTRSFVNDVGEPLPHQAETMTGRCGPYLPETMRRLGYRTWGVGKFHTKPWNEDLGYETQLHTMENWLTPEMRKGDAFGSWLRENHPEFDFVEQVHGERSDMYYRPQTSPLPFDATVEHWDADRAIELINAGDGRPYFGMVSFIGPHPPFAPPVPYNRLYDPDKLPDPVHGPAALDELDEVQTAFDKMAFAHGLSDEQWRIVKSRYYGDITYIDACLGRILDAVEARDDADNTLICFFSDHGEMMGDRGMSQKATYFEPACHVPMLVSWPARLPANQRNDSIACLADLFGIATGAAGTLDVREGIDLLGVIDGRAKPREYLLGYIGHLGANGYKLMVRGGRWKYIFLATGGHELLFDVQNDPQELHNLAAEEPEVLARFREQAVAMCDNPDYRPTLRNGKLKSYEAGSFKHFGGMRIIQMEPSIGVEGFPEHPRDALEAYGFE